MVKVVDLYLVRTLHSLPIIFCHPSICIIVSFLPISLFFVSYDLNIIQIQAHEKKGVGQAEQHPVVSVDESSTEETDDESSKVEIIDENTVQDIEGNVKVPIGVITNETSEALSDNNDDNGDKVNKNDDLTIEDEIEKNTIE